MVAETYGVLREYYDDMAEAAYNFIDERYEEYDSFEEIYDDMFIEDSITGNETGHCPSYDARMVEKMFWEPEFHDYLKDLDADIAKLVEEGKEVVDIWARCFMLSTYLYSPLLCYWMELKSEEEED